MTIFSLIYLVFMLQHILADVWVSKMSDLGVNDQQYFCRTHIGHLINTGDTVLGYVSNETDA